jgi:choline dehydrogenase
VLCAGTPMSPALLLRSGIGPAEDLRALGLPVHADLPGVGAGYLDQPGAVLPALPVPAAIEGDWILHRYLGRLAAVPGFAADESFYLCLFVGPPPGGGEAILALMVGDLAMGSRGWVRLASPDPAVPPLVDCGFYTAPDDLARMVAMYRHAFDIAVREPFAAAVAGFAWGLDDSLIADDERLTELVRGMTFSRINPVGGAAMGPAGSVGAVVDGHCRVHGIAGLRVVDLSIVPVPLRAPAALTAMAIGEHAAALIAAEPG